MAQTSTYITGGGNLQVTISRGENGVITTAIIKMTTNTVDALEAFASFMNEETQLEVKAATYNRVLGYTLYVLGKK